MGDTEDHGDDVNQGNPGVSDENDREPGGPVDDADTSAIPDNQQVLDENGNPRTDENGNPYVVAPGQLDTEEGRQQLEQDIEDGVQTTQSDSTDGRDPNSQQEVDTDHPEETPDLSDPNSRTGEDTQDTQQDLDDIFDMINSERLNPTPENAGGAGVNEQSDAGGYEATPTVTNDGQTVGTTQQESQQASESTAGQQAEDANAGQTVGSEDLNVVQDITSTNPGAQVEVPTDPTLQTESAQAPAEQATTPAPAEQAAPTQENVTEDDVFNAIFGGGASDTTGTEGLSGLTNMGATGTEGLDGLTDMGATEQGN